MISVEDFNIYIINYWVLIPAVIIIIILSYLEKRKIRQDLCHGRPALPIPFRFLDGYENRTAYAMAFGTATSTVVSLILSERTLEFDLPLWAKALYVYLQAIVGCLTCFPLFACLTTRYRAVGAIFCIFYSLLWLALKVIQVVQDVQITTTSTNASNNQQNNTITINMSIAYEILQSVPIIFCYLVLIGYCFYLLHRCYTTKTYFNKGMESTLKVHQEEHVRWVFRKFRLSQSNVNCNPSQTFIDKMNNSVKLRYFTSFPFFRYPARIIAFSFVQLNILYWAGLLLGMKTISILYPLIYAEYTHQYTEAFAVDFTVILSVCSACALIMCIINALAQIFSGARNYRYDMLRIYQGHRSFVQVSNNNSPQNILTRSMSFPGYQVAFMLWGIFLCFTTVFFLILIPVLGFYLTAKFDILTDLLLSLLQLLSFPLTVFVMFYLQVFMTKQVLLQEKVKVTDENPPLNVDNRKFYEIVNYYSLFTNMAVGLFTCLFRILQSAFLGIFSVARLDRSVFPLNLESWDRGYAAYTSMLLVDNAHNNPCMKVFAHLLWTKTLAVRLIQDHHCDSESIEEALLFPDQREGCMTSVTVMPNVSPASEESINPWTLINTEGIKGSNRAQTRWNLAYTLINNPQLCKLRKHKLKRDSIDDRNLNMADDAEERSSETETDGTPLLVGADNSTSYCSTQNSTNNNILPIDVLNQQTPDSFA